MLNAMQARALHDQIVAAFFDDSEESCQILEKLMDQASEGMSDQDWARLCLAIGWETTDPPVTPTKKIIIQFEVKPADCWIGAYWRRQGRALHIWICLLPCLPIHLTLSISLTERKHSHGR